MIEHWPTPTRERQEAIRIKRQRPMREKVARALAEESGLSFQDNPKLWLAHADAALVAMRDGVTEAMRDAGLAETSVALTGADIEPVFSAMCDTALAGN